MKMQKIIYLVALTAALVPITGCHKGLQKTTPLPGWAQKPPGSDEGVKPLDSGNSLANANIDKTGLIPMGDKDLHNWKPSADQPFTGDTVYFEFDKATVKSSETHKLDSIASRMKGLQGKALRIEGHCDERGTEEYNRSLGDRRALALREYLVRAGIDYQMIDTISYGEDRPLNPGHNEAAWSKNRRGEFVVIEPPR